MLILGSVEIGRYKASKKTLKLFCGLLIIEIETAYQYRSDIWIFTIQ